MKYLSVQQMSQKWNLAPRTIRLYCQTGKIPGAYLMGKTWIVPEEAILPEIKKETKLIIQKHIDEKSREIAIVGGGISGVFAAIRIKEKHPNFRVSIFERNNKLLRKIYVTGNGKCNFANSGSLVNKYNNESFVLPIIKEFPFSKISQCFEELGVHYKLVNDLAYPMSESAETVALMLDKKIDELAIDAHLEEKFIDYRDSQLITDKNTYHFDYLIFACGGKSSPQLGSDGSIFNILEKHGYRIIITQPSLCPIKVKENVFSIEGLRAKANLTLLVDNKSIRQEEGELLFKKDGLSGIGIFNLTHFINMQKSCKKINICVDFAPNIANIVPERYIEFVHPKLANYLCKNNLDIHNTFFTYKSLYDFPHSQVTSGGLSVQEVNQNLRSKRDNKVFFIGEILDVDAVCGGFNIMWALASAEKVSNNSFDYGK